MALLLLEHHRRLLGEFRFCILVEQQVPLAAARTRQISIIAKSTPVSSLLSPENHKTRLQMVVFTVLLAVHVAPVCTPGEC